MIRRLEVEAARLRRTAYSSGRREVIGFTRDFAQPFARKTRRHSKEPFFKLDSTTKFTPFRGAFRSRRY